MELVFLTCASQQVVRLSKRGPCRDGIWISIEASFKVQQSPTKLYRLQLAGAARPGRLGCFGEDLGTVKASITTAGHTSKRSRQAGAFTHVPSPWLWALPLRLRFLQPQSWLLAGWRASSHVWMLFCSSNWHFAPCTSTPPKMHLSPGGPTCPSCRVFI